MKVPMNLTLYDKLSYDTDVSSLKAGTMLYISLVSLEVPSILQKTYQMLFWSFTLIALEAISVLVIV